MASTRTAHDFTVAGADGAPVDLARYAGKVLLIVNTASKCGFTPQYEGLEALWRDYRDRGLVVLAFPCNQFGAQEPGDAEEIASFCATNYAVDFPLMGKVEVNGSGANPLWSWMKEQKGGLLGSAIKWNFTKFLVDRGGRVVGRYAPTTKPEELRRDVEALLG